MTRLPPLPGRSPARPTSPISEAQPGCQGQPARAELCSPRSGGLDSPTKRSYRFHPTPATTAPERGLIPAAICGVKSDTRHLRVVDGLLYRATGYRTIRPFRGLRRLDRA